MRRLKSLPEDWTALARTERTSAAQASRLWRALVDGRWSLVAHVDAGGKHLVLARRNQRGLVDGPPLTPRERRAFAYGALGHPLKLIAYELGVAPSTAASHLRGALRKLGLRSRTELVQVFGPAAR